jgi:hypothetical protein
MLVFKKHPDSTEILAADYAKRLATGETLSAVTLQPSATGLTFGTATINTAGAISVPNGGASITQNQGVSFSCVGGGGTDTLPDGNTGKAYTFEVKVSTSNSPRVIGETFTIWVSTAY